MTKKGTRVIDRVFFLWQDLGSERKVAKRLDMSRSWVNKVLKGEIAWTKELDGAGRATLKNSKKFDSRRLRNLNQNIRRSKKKALEKVQKGFELGDIVKSDGDLLDFKVNPWDTELSDNPRLEKVGLDKKNREFTIFYQLQDTEAAVEEFEVLEFPARFRSNKEYKSIIARGARFSLDSFEGDYKSIEVVGIITV